MTQTFTGCAPFYPDFETDAGHVLLVAVSCRIGPEQVEVDALLDCAAEWSVLNRGIAESLGLFEYAGELELTLSTRHGPVDGTLVPSALTYVAAEGDDVTIDARWFVSEHWYGPTVIGWRGCLNLIRFALNPDEDRLYFAAAEGRGTA